MNGSTVLLSNIQSRLLLLLFFIFFFLLSTSPYLCSVVTVSIYLVSCRNFNINRVVLGGAINPQELLLSRFFLFFVDFSFSFSSSLFSFPFLRLLHLRLLSSSYAPCNHFLAPSLADPFLLRTLYTPFSSVLTEFQDCVINSQELLPGLKRPAPP